MFKPKINPLPNSQTLLWSARDNADGSVRHTTPVLQPRVAGALKSKQRPTGVLESLPQLIGKNLMQSMAKRQKLSEEVFTNMKRLEDVQQQVLRFIPNAPNVVSNVVSSEGEAVVRYEMAGGNFAEEGGQYGRETTTNGVVSGSAVCTQGNNAVFRALVAMEQERAAESSLNRMRARAQGIAPHKPTPITLAVNQMPHVFVLWGDPRESDEVLTGNIWGATPVVASWTNTAFSAMDYVIRGQYLASASVDASLGVSLAEMAELAGQRPSITVVNDYLRENGRPPVGPGLLKDVLEQYKAGHARLTDVWTMANDPGLIYESPSGETFLPSIDSNSFQRHRAALENPMYEEFRKMDPEG
jgi:hypothetical protein